MATNAIEMRSSPTSDQHIYRASPSTMMTNESLAEQPTMIAEIEAAVTFLTDLIKAAQFSKQTAEQFRQALTVLLNDYYDGHWYPREPLKGSGFRCLRVNGLMNPLLKKAAQMCSMPLNKFRQAFPVELTVWVDPGDVSVRFGEEGSIGVYYAKAGNCLKHDNHQMEDLQRLTAPKRSSPQLVLQSSGCSSPTTSPYAPFTSNPSMKIGSPPRKILPFMGGRQTPTNMASMYQQQQQNAYVPQQSQQMLYRHGFGASPVEQQQHQLHQSPPQFDYQQAAVRRPSPSPSPPDTTTMFGGYGNGGFSDWCKSEYQMYGNIHYGSSSQSASSPYGRFKMMNAVGRQEPVGAN